MEATIQEHTALVSDPMVIENSQIHASPNGVAHVIKDEEEGLIAEKHGCNSRGAAPASDSYQHSMPPPMQLHACPWKVPLFIFFLVSNSVRNGPKQAPNRSISINTSQNLRFGRHEVFT